MYGPTVLPVTLALNVQLPLAGTVAVAIDSVLDSAVAVTLPPTQVVAGLGIAAIVMPPGSVSVSAALVSGVAVWFDSVTVSVEVPPCGMLVGANALVTEAAEIMTHAGRSSSSYCPRRRRR